MNGLLKRQLRKFVESSRRVPKHLDPLLEAVSDAYDGFDASRHLMERSLDISSQELRDVNKELKSAYAELKKAQEQLIQAEKLQAIGRLASGVAHEVKNPLGIILQAISFLEREIKTESEDVHEVVGMIKRNIKRADSIVRALVDFSKRGELNIEPGSINDIVETSLPLVNHQIRLESIRIIKELSDGLPEIPLDKTKMEQVLVNLFMNAIQSMPKGGKLYLRSYKKRRVYKKNDRDIEVDSVVIEIEDTGLGISESNLKKVFDPFFTTKGPKGGAGLGLAVTKNIIDMHNGAIDIDSKEGIGTKVTIFLKV